MNENDQDLFGFMKLITEKESFKSCYKSMQTIAGEERRGLYEGE